MAKSRTIKFLQNAGGSALYQIVNSLCGLITPRIILQCYGSNLNGLVSSITQFLSALAVVEAGLALASQQSLYKPLVEKDYNKISAVVSAARTAYTHVGLLFTALTALLAVLYPVFTDVEELNYLQVVLLVFILSMNYVLSFFVISKYQALFQADQRVYVISLSKAIARIINTVVIIVVSLAGAHILLMRTLAVSSLLIQSLIIWLYSKKHYPNINYYAKPDKSALNQRWDAMYLQLLSAVTVSAPAILLTLISTLEEVSIYSIYNMVFSALMGILGIFMSGINASFGEMLNSKESGKTKEAYYEFENAYYVLISIVYLVTLIMITPFIKIYTDGITDANYLLPGIGVLFTANALLYNLKTPQGMMLQAAGLFKKTRLQNSIQMAIMLIGGVVLGYFWGIYGVLVASILSNGYRCIDQIIFIPKTVLQDSPLKTFRRVLIVFALIILAYVPAKFLIDKMDISTFGMWIVFSILATIYSSVVIVAGAFVFERNCMIQTTRRILGIFKRKKG